MIQSTMGSFLRVKVIYKNLTDFLSNLDSDIPILGMDIGASSIYSKPIPKDAVVIIGNESRGISKNVLSCVNDLISIPAFGKAESLNAAIAAGILCSEYRRFH